MYDRAPRSLTNPAGSTFETVGPGSYDIPETSNRKCDAYAPFLSMTTRETFLDVNDASVAAPGPGQYDPVVVKDRVRGGASIANKSERFRGKKSEVPGPGQYTLSKSSDWIKEKHRNKYIQEQPADKDGAVLRTSRIVFRRKPDPPSIPFPGQAYGYEEADDGTLQRQNMPPSDSSKGPAYYNVYQRDTETTKKYRGAHFGNRTSKRMEFKGSRGPGPGDYDPYKKPPLTTPMDIILEENKKKPFESQLPRYHEVIVHQESKKAVPGPGKYEIRSQFMVKSAPPGLDHDPHSTAPFGSQEKRFNDRMSKTPAPGSYNDPRHAFESMKRIRGLKRSPFGQTSVRFQHERHSKKNPGPGTYNIPDMTSDVLRKAHLESTTKKGAFGSTSTRIAPMTKRHEDTLPGPAHYLTVSEPAQNGGRSSRVVNPSSTFASITNRLSSPPDVVKDNPPPGSYEVIQSHDRTQGRVMYPYAQAVNRNAHKAGGFLSSSNRFGVKRQPGREESNPGPGTYESQRGNVMGGLMVTKEQRFRKNKEDEVPGPGAYEYSPLQMHSVLKGTFNATLNNPVAVYEGLQEEPVGSSKQAFLLGV